MAKKYGKRSIRSSEREADFRERENPFPEIWHRNGKCNLSRGRMAAKVYFQYRGYYYDEETDFYYCFAGNDRNGDRCEAEILVVFTGSTGGVFAEIIRRRGREFRRGEAMKISRGFI